MDRKIGGQKDRWIERQMDRKIVGQFDRKIVGQKDSWIERQLDRKIDGQRYSFIERYILIKKS